MKANYKVIFIAEKAASAVLSMIPEGFLAKAKSAITGKRKSFFSNTKSFFDNRISKAINNFDLVSQVASRKLKGADVLELGSGGHGVDLILLYLLGARKIYTVDIQFFGYLYMRQAIHDFKESLPKIAETLEVEMEDLEKRYEQISSLDSVDDMMRVMNIRFFTFKELTSGSINLERRVNFLFSESNLQRIPLDDVNKVLASITQHLEEACVSFHRVDSGDINTQITRPLYDPSLWKFHFLKYSDKAWKLRITKRLGSQNRLRQPEFLELFKQHGFAHLYCENYLEREDLQRIKDFKVAERFRKFSERENVIGHFRFVSVYDPEKKRGGGFQENDIYLKGKGFKGTTKPAWNPKTGLLAEESLPQ